MAGDSRHSRSYSSREYESTTKKNDFAVDPGFLDSWAELPTSCALDVPVVGSEDDAIHCFKEG